ncbi:MAG: hypothetical protein ABF274_07255 [Nonlabens sp.]|jgi:hypothetical protein|uniref:hypothetical protein n=1 Tax=Nonlabens sp. TaxID=1888209 RepID=UPI00321C23C8
MKHIKFLLPVLFTFFIISCATVEDYATKKWKGKTKSELVKKKGEPLAIKEENGSEIYYYGRTSVATSRDSFSGMSGTSKIIEAYYMKNNIVYKVKQENLPEDE